MQAPPVLSAAAAEGGESECWDPILDRATGAIYYHYPVTGATRWHCEPLAKPQQQLRQLQQQLLSEPYPQVIDAGADLLARDNDGFDALVAAATGGSASRTATRRTSATRRP